jgi:CheY-like chemotaxis protein
MALRNVLVVDDDPGIRESLGEVLRAEGYTVRLAENGAVALEVMRSGVRPDVVVLDLMMPVLSGWEVLEEVESDAALRAMPILVLSAMCAPIAGADRQVGGVRMSLSKPPDIDALLDALWQLGVPAAEAVSAGN